MQPPKQPDFDVFAEIMTQLREINRKVDNQATKQDLNNYVLQAVFHIAVEELKHRDEAQQKDIDSLEERVLTQGQRLFAYIGSGIGAIGGILAILHYFIK